MSRASIPSETITVDMSSTNIGTSFVQLKAALANDASMIEVINPSSTAIQLGIGPSSGEQAVGCWHPLNTGARGPVPIQLNAGQRLSAKSFTGTINAGVLIVNLYK